MKKERFDQYYTPVDVASRFAEIVVSLFGADRTFLEPSAGTGVFVDCLRVLGASSIIAYDIEPKGDNIIEADFLELKTMVPPGTIAIGNPPFGKGGSTAIKFMNHCLTLGCEAVCFINPISVGTKIFTRNQISPYLHPSKEFRINGGIHYDSSKEYEGTSALRTSFQIWTRSSRKRSPFVPKYETADFRDMRISCRKETRNGKVCELPVGKIEADFTVVSHGPLAGTVKPFDESQKANVNRFIKVAPGRRVEEVQEKLRNTDFTYFLEACTITHTPSLSPTEIVLCYEAADYRLRWGDVDNFSLF